MPCNKVSYPTRAAALVDIKAIQNARKWRSKKYSNAQKSNRKQRVYECPYCGLFHLTTAPKNYRK